MRFGLRKKDRPHWSCCHIWGVDDPLFQKGNDVVKDRRFFSCVANIVLTPQIEQQIIKRRTAIKRDLENAGLHYPRAEVREVLAYWRIEL